MRAIDSFIDRVTQQGGALYRDFAWRRTEDPYAILVSEVMLQQTQTQRVERYFEAWMQRVPSIDALAAASTADVLALWQGLGYNRRALALKKAAEHVSEHHKGILPKQTEDLLKLPGIGPATAAGIRAFAHNEPAVYLETNVRTVLLHEFYPKQDNISDRELQQLLERISKRVEARGISARSWNYALLDYGAYLKKIHPNPSRRSKHHSTQSPYEGSRRQKRARLLEAILADPGQSSTTLAKLYDYDLGLTEDILNDLKNEGFIKNQEDTWFV